MAEIVNLRMARKQKARAERERTAAENRALHGRSKTDRQLDAKRGERAEAALDGHRREPGDRRD